MRLKIVLTIVCLLTIFSCLFFTGCVNQHPEKENTSVEETTNIIEEYSTETTTFDTGVIEEETILQPVSTAQLQNNSTTSNNSKNTNATNKSVAKTNSTNNANTVKQNRIVATSPAVCDIMDRLGIDLVGVPDSTSALPARYNSVKKVGSAMEPDMEIIKSLNPTDVVGPDTLKADLKAKYDNMKVNSTFVNLRSVKGLYDSVKLIGDKYGKSSEANAIIQEYNSFISSYKSKHSGKNVKVLVLMGLPGSYLVATQNSYAGSLVELAGATNVFHDSTKDFVSISPEEMLAKDPDVIIRTAHGLPKEALEMFNKEFSTNDIWKHFRAVKNNRVYDVDYTLFGMSATFDYPQALSELEPMLYGD